MSLPYGLRQHGIHCRANCRPGDMDGIRDSKGRELLQRVLGGREETILEQKEPAIDDWAFGNDEATLPTAGTSWAIYSSETVQTRQRRCEEDQQARPFDSFLRSWPTSASIHKFSHAFWDTMTVNFTRLYQAAFKGDLAGKWTSKMSTGGATAVGGKVSYSTLRKSLRPIDVEDRFGRDMIIRHP